MKKYFIWKFLNKYHRRNISNNKINKISFKQNGKKKNKIHYFSRVKIKDEYVSRDVLRGRILDVHSLTPPHGNFSKFRKN